MANFLLLFWRTYPEKNGIGYDGQAYASIAARFPSIVFDHQISLYSIQRILPSGIIYYTLRLFHLSATQEQMPFIFSIYNTIILALGVYFWHKIANFLQWNGAVRLLSFCGLFLNYAILKMNTYDPVLTDTSAFICGLGMLYFYLLNKKYGLLLSIIAGTFIFPTLMFIGLLLFIFLNTDEKKSYAFSENNPRSSTIIALISALLITISVWTIYLKIGEQDMFALGRYSRFPVLYISLLAVFTYFFLMLRPICENFKETIIKTVRQVFSYRLFIAICLAVLLKILLFFLSSKATGALTSTLFFELISIRALAYPGIFLVSNIIYYGPVVCLIICFWREIINYLKRRMDLGLFIVTTFYALILINTEARQSINFLPIGVIVVSQILNTKTIPSSFVFSFIALDLLLSRFWLPLSHGWESLLTNPPQITLTFPMQWFFMSHGPWMSHTMYLVFLPISITTLILIRLSMRRLTMAEDKNKRLYY